MASSVGSHRAPLRIGLATYASGWGGTELCTLRLATQLSMRGHDVTIMEFGKPVYTAHANLFELRVKRSAHLLPSDIIVLMKGGLADGNLLFDLRARISSAAYLTIENSTPVPRPNPTKRKRGDKRRWPLSQERHRLLRFASILPHRIRSRVPSRIICVSDSIRSRLETTYRFDSTKLQVIPNCVDSSRFVPSQARRQEARDSWGVPKSAFVIGSVSRLDPLKYLGDLLACASRAMTIRPDLDIRVVLIGDGNARNQLYAEAARWGIEKSVVFAGHSDHPESAYPGFDVFALTSRREGGPLALIEAMSAGVIPVAFRVGIAPDAISNCELGWLVQAGDMDGFTDALISALSLTPNAREAMGSRCRTRVTEAFDYSLIMPRLIRVIESARRS